MSACARGDSGYSDAWFQLAAAAPAAPAAAMDAVTARGTERAAGFARAAGPRRVRRRVWPMMGVLPDDLIPEVSPSARRGSPQHPTGGVERCRLRE